MNTPAHLLFSLALLPKANVVRYPFAILFGALLPDLGMIIFYVWEKIRNVPESVIWSIDYYHPVWQGVFDLANSIPLVLLGGLIAYKVGSQVVLMVFAGMLLHALFDLPLHHEDAHRHFFPFSDYRFHSPVSYWNPVYYGNIISRIEMGLFLCSAIWLYRQFADLKLRIIVLSLSVIYALYTCYVLIVWAG